MSNEILILRITQYLQAEYIKTGINGPVEWKPLAVKLAVTEDEIFDALNIALTSTRNRVVLKPSGMNRIQLGPKSLAIAELERKKCLQFAPLRNTLIDSSWWLSAEMI